MEQHHVLDRWFPLSAGVAVLPSSSSTSPTGRSGVTRRSQQDVKLGEVHVAIDFVPSTIGEAARDGASIAQSGSGVAQEREDILSVEVWEGQNVSSPSWLGRTDPVVQVELIGRDYNDDHQSDDRLAVGAVGTAGTVIASARTGPPTSGNSHPTWEQKLELRLPQQLSSGDQSMSTSPSLRVTLWNTNCVRAREAGLDAIGSTQLLLPSGVLFRGAVRERWLLLNSHHSDGGVDHGGQSSSDSNKPKIRLRIYRGRAAEKIPSKVSNVLIHC
jgi:hypothetical protein